MRKLHKTIKDIFARNRFVEAHSTATNADAKLYLQILIAAAFFILSVANIFSKSYLMLLFTASGCVINGVSAVFAIKTGKRRICALSSIITCSLLFGFFVIYGGNDGFACLWVALLPFFAMVVMDFVIGLCASLFFQIFLMAVFWTPVRGLLLYEYSEQFCLRFPLFFLVTFALGLSLTISLRKSQYNECVQLLKLEEMTAAAHKLARLDSLTGLANRRCAYEEFDARYTDPGRPHCIVMCDIDYFKRANDTYGHEFGDDVLIVLSRYLREQLPEDYLKSRWGGEEFLLAANESIDEVYAQIEKLRCCIAAHEFHADGMPVHISLTFGLAAYTGKEDIHAAINQADSRLYIGKKTQRNCTVMEG